MSDPLTKTEIANLMDRLSEAEGRSSVAALAMDKAIQYDKAMRHELEVVHGKIRSEMMRSVGWCGFCGINCGSDHK